MAPFIPKAVHSRKTKKSRDYFDIFFPHPSLHFDENFFFFNTLLKQSGNGFRHQGDAQLGMAAKALIDSSLN